jgi:hypothetical protein
MLASFDYSSSLPFGMVYYHLLSTSTGAMLVVDGYALKCHSGQGLPGQNRRGRICRAFAGMTVNYAVCSWSTAIVCKWLIWRAGIMADTSPRFQKFRKLAPEISQLQ